MGYYSLRGFLLLPFIFSVFIFPQKSFSDQSIDPLIHPGNRYSRENTKSDILAHWVGPVGVQFVGIREPNTQMALLSDILAFGAAAQIELNVFGFPNSMFESTSVSNGARIVILEYNAEYEDLLSKGGVGESIGIVDVGSANRTVATILSSGLVRQTDGCFAKWRATDLNEIEGIVLAVSDAIDQAEREACFSNLIPSAFGVSPVLSRYDTQEAVEGSRSEEVVIFSDRSELVLALSAAATCREDLGEYGTECPFRLINGIFLHHAALAKLGRN